MTISWKDFFGFLGRPLSPKSQATYDKLYRDWKQCSCGNPSIPGSHSAEVCEISTKAALTTKGPQPTGEVHPGPEAPF